jgi:hypothetical protein
MSHFSRVKTVIRDQILLQDSLRQLHYRFQAGEHLPIRGFAGGMEHGEVVVDTGSRYDIGFQRQSDDSYAVCADWWGVQGNSPIREQQFLQDVARTYAHMSVRQQVLQQGLIIEQELTLPNGEIELLVAERF